MAVLAEIARVAHAAAHRILDAAVSVVRAVERAVLHRAVVAQERRGALAGAEPVADAVRLALLIGAAGHLAKGGLAHVHVAVLVVVARRAAVLAHLLGGGNGWVGWLLWLVGGLVGWWVGWQEL